MNKLDKSSGNNSYRSVKHNVVIKFVLSRWWHYILPCCWKFLKQCYRKWISYPETSCLIFKSQQWWHALNFFFSQKLYQCGWGNEQRWLLCCLTEDCFPQINWFLVDSAQPKIKSVPLIFLQASFQVLVNKFLNKEKKKVVYNCIENSLGSKAEGWREWFA